MGNIVESLYRTSLNESVSDDVNNLSDSTSQVLIDPSNLDRTIENKKFKILEKTLLGNFYDLFYVMPNGDVADEPYNVRKNYMSLDKDNNVYLRKNSEIEFFFSSKNGWVMTIYSDGVDCGSFYKIENIPAIKAIALD